MPKLRKKISLETIFGPYVVDELLGEGGAGRVYGGIGIDNSAIAIKVLAEDRTNADKRARFKNEIAFLQKNKHPNIVTVLDHGVARTDEINGPFYVMPRFDSNLREIIKVGIPVDRVLPLFSQILDGVEAAHFNGVIHRDLKPENILYNKESDSLAIADFGTARFTEDLVVTTVETGPTQRLANFRYAAPEQRVPGKSVLATADIWALGLMLNEMFTGVVPDGTEYRVIADAASNFGFLDEIVARMRRQAPEERPNSIADIKGLIQRHQSEAVSLQRLSRLDGTVIKKTDIDEPLAETPPRLIDADWNNGQLTLILDRPVTPEWVQALYRMGSFSAVGGKPPSVFSFNGNRATVGVAAHEVQMVIDYFKTWLPIASRTLKSDLEEARRKQEATRKEQLRREREAEVQRLRVLRDMKI